MSDPKADDRREEIDARLAEVLGEPCEACGHSMIRFRGQCWSNCGCTSGKHARVAQDQP